LENNTIKLKGIHPYFYTEIERKRKQNTKAPKKLSLPPCLFFRSESTFGQIYRKVLACS